MILQQTRKKEFSKQQYCTRIDRFPNQGLRKPCLPRASIKAERKSSTLCKINDDTYLKKKDHLLSLAGRQIGSLFFKPLCRFFAHRTSDWIGVVIIRGTGVAQQQAMEHYELLQDSEPGCFLCILDPSLSLFQIDFIYGAAVNQVIYGVV